MSRLLERHPGQLAEALRASGRRRGYAIRAGGGEWRSSHPVLDGVAAFLAADARDCRGHEALFFEVGRHTGALHTAFLHETTRGQAHGGLRYQAYDRLEDLLRDGLRLSLGMTRKSALAGLWWGGGKGIVAREHGHRPDEDGFRRALFAEYGAFVSSLRGCYVTAEDAGTTPSDLAEVFRHTRFATCIPRRFGGSGNPSDTTAAGVVCAMEAALDFLGAGSLAGKTVAIQGAGHVGSALIRRLLGCRVARVTASEVEAEQRAALESGYEGEPLEVRATPPGDDAILSEPCDVLAPCALGGTLSAKTIPGIRARVVCGAANNPLAEEPDARRLADRDVVYVPDFLSNRMGIVSCANEQYGSVNDDAMTRRHLGRSWRGGIYRTTLAVLESAAASGRTPAEAAARLADDLAREPHPIWGHRSPQIVESLVADRWDEGESR